MKKLTKYTLIAAGICIMGGISLVAAGYALGGEAGFWIDKDGIHTNQERKSRQTTVTLGKTKVDGVKSLDISAAFGDIILADSSDENYYLEYELQSTGEIPEYRVEDGSLIFQYRENTNQNFSINVFGFGIMDNWEEKENYVKIYVPKHVAMDRVNLKSSDGAIKSISLSAGEVNVTAKYGSVDLSGAEADKVFIESSDGAVRCEAITAQEVAVRNKYGSTELDTVTASLMNIENSDGRIKLANIDTGNLSIINKYGSTAGSSVKADTFTSEQTDGAVTIEGFDVKNGTIRNSYGSVSLQLTEKEEDYNYDLKSKYGSARLNNRSYDEGETTQINNEADRNLDIKVSDGSIKIITK